MNFSRLPDNAFLKILEYLPLEERIRVGRVDKSFRRIAKLATSRTESLNLLEDRFRNLTSDQLAVILDLCSSYLKQIKIGYAFGDDDDRFQELASTFSNYHCPRLIDIDLGRTPIDRAVFEQLVQNCQNVEIFAWNKDFVGFPAITNNRLKKLCLVVSSDANLQTLIGRCPNLEELDLSPGINITANILDQFFASVPNANRISIKVVSMANFEKAALINFYHLPLTKLNIIGSDYFAGDSLLSKVATSFPNLRELSIEDLEPTNQGITWLAVLQELQVLHLYLRDVGSNKYDQGIHRLAHCHKLRELNVYLSKITGVTMVNLIRSCPQLEYVRIWGITQVDNPEQAVVILESLAGIPQREITIRFPASIFEYCKIFASVWKMEPVKAAIEKLEEDDGVKIMITG